MCENADIWAGCTLICYIPMLCDGMACEMELLDLSLGVSQVYAPIVVNMVIVTIRRRSHHILEQN